MATPIPSNMARFSLAEIARITGGQLRGDAELSVTGVAIDSRAVVEGGLFVAVRGERMDGHAYLEQARAAGAAAALVHPGTELDQGFACVEVEDTTLALGALARAHRVRWGKKVVAITGSAGKTTTKELTAGALAGLGLSVLKTPGNLNNQFGVPMTLLMLDDSHDVAVLEVGTSAPGEIAYLGGLVQPDVAAVLLAAAAHTEGLGDVDAVAREKASLWDSLGDDGWAVVNADDPRLVEHAKGIERRWSFGYQDMADVTLLGASVSATGTDVDLRIHGAKHAAHLKLLGEPAAIDACCALACAVSMQGPAAIEGALAGLAGVEPTPGRLHLQPAAGGFLVLDDSYNANPQSMRLALQTTVQLAERTGGRALALLGDMRELGPLSKAAHEDIGVQAVQLGISALVGTGLDMAHAVNAAVRAAGGRFAKHPTRVAHIADPADAARVARSLLRPGDVVLVKGSRSMQLESAVFALLSEDGAP